MVELVSGYTHLERRGDRWWGLSPFKSEKTPSFTVRPTDGFYYCFATQRGGDLFKFVTEMEGLSFPEAVEWLAERAGVQLEESGEPTQEDRERQALLELYERVTGTFTYLLTTDARGSDALAYVRDRGVTDATITRFDLGYAPVEPEWLYRLLRSKSYSDDFLARSGLFARRAPRFALFHNRLMFPIRDERRRVVALGGRALSPDDRAKYINSPETSIYAKKRVLYGVPQALDSMRRDRAVHLVEGYMDVLALSQAGVANVVAPLGTAFTAEQAKLLNRWVGRVVFVFDSDDAGVEAAFRGAVTAEQAGLEALAAPLDGDKDPADVALSGGSESVRALVASPIPILDYLIASAMSHYRTVDALQRSELVLRKIFPYIKVVRSEVRREMALDQLGDSVGVTPRAIRTDFERWQRGERSQSQAPIVVDTRTQYSIRREVGLMLATAHDSGLFAYLRRFVGPHELEDPEARRLYLAMEDAYRHGEPLPQGLIDRLHGEKGSEATLSRLASDEFLEFGERDVDRAVRTMQIERLHRRQLALESDIRTLEPGRDDLLLDLLNEKGAVDRELNELKREHTND